MKSSSKGKSSSINIEEKKTANRIDGVNLSRGEGLPYKEEVKPYTSQILLSRHGAFGESHISGINNRRGEGLPYTEKEINLEISNTF